MNNKRIESADQWLDDNLHEFIVEGRVGKFYIDREKLINVLNKVPRKFFDDEVIQRLLMLSKQSTDEYIDLDEIYFKDELFTLGNSIFKDLGTPTSVEANQKINKWLRQAQEQFELIYKFECKPSFDDSINPIELATKELTDINSFFNHGEKNSHFLNINSPDFVELDDLYQTYQDLIYGNYDNNLFNIDESLDSYHMKHLLFPFWYKSARVQAYLWLRSYLDNVVNTGSFEVRFTPKKDPVGIKQSSTKKGFTIASPKKTMPALHDSLIDGGLINNINLKDFEDAFISEKGCIEWCGNKDKLGYLIKNLRAKNIITSKNHMETSTRVFKATSGKALNAGSLSTSADNLSGNAVNLMGGIIKKCLLIAD